MRTSKVNKYFNFKLTDEYSSELDFYIYEECTADGYSVWVATEFKHSINVVEEIFFYDTDLKYVLINHIKDSSKELETVIYVDDLSSYYVSEALDELRELMKKENG